MSEANNNQVSFSSESNSELISSNNIQSQESTERSIASTEKNAQNELKMNWQKVAHKLREYNRKLLKKEFRLQQELAEIENKFNKYVEQSRNSDILVAQQEAEIQNYQQQIAILTQHLTVSEQELTRKEATIEELSQQYQLSQQQTAQLERECTLLQESYSQKNYESIAKEKENKDLQTKLNQQQRYTLQYKTELNRYQEKATVDRKESLASDRPKPTYTRSIQPWSTSNSEPQIALPKTKPQLTTARSTTIKSSKTIKTAAQIASWSASGIEQKQKTNTSKSKSSTGGKPKSLAAVDLPTFPRHR